MCEKCDQPPAPERRSKKRASLSDIDPSRHCAIIGACLSLAELKSVANKFSDYVRAQATDYEMHSAIVHMAAHDKKLAKALTKIIDRKYNLTLLRFSKAGNDEQLSIAWNDAVAKGDIAAGLWAILSHPAATEELCARVYGEVHMISHQMGQAARAEIKNSRRLEQTNKDLRHELDSLRIRYNEALSTRDALLQDLRQKLEAESLRANRLARASGDSGEMEKLRAALQDMKNKQNQERSEQDSLRDALRVQEAARRDLEKQLEKRDEENAQLRDEAQKTENRIVSLLTPSDGIGACDSSCANLDLCGRCILFVGGRNQHVPHLRRIVERCNGAFTHHDGGLEENLGLLPGLVGRADAVLFAVDNISHAAQDELKRHCRRQDRVFVPVRRSGIAAYLSALQTLAEGGELQN